AQSKNQPRHCIVATIARLVYGMEEEAGREQEKSHLAGRCQQKSRAAAPKKPRARRQPQDAGCRQPAAMQGIDASPGGARSDEKTDTNSSDETPQHFVGMPGHAGERQAQPVRCEGPDQYGNAGPQGARDIQRPETQFKKG